MEDLHLQLTEAQNSRGVMLEVQIRRELPPIYVLTCQFDATASEPLWSLYEGEDGSKVLWSCPNNQLEMVYGMICMSLTSGPGVALPSNLAPQAGQPTVQPGQQQQQPQQPYPQQQQQQPYPPPAGYPQQGPPQGYPQQQQQPPYPQNAPYPGYPAQPYPPQQQPPGWVQTVQTGAYQPLPYPGAQTGGGYPPTAPANDGSQLRPTDLSGFVDLLTKGQQSNLLLGHLFVEAGVLPEPCLEAALKLQELVRKFSISNAAAIEALRRVAETGGTLDEDVLNKCRAMFPCDPPTAQAATINRPAAALEPREMARQVVMLLLQSNIVTENDVSTAEGVRRKHGGDVGSILVAAGKIEKATFEAAKHCQPLVHEQRLTSDEAFRIVRHCQKNKASFQDACRDLAIKPL